MYLFYFLGLLVVGCVVLCLLWYYPNRQTTLFVKTLVGLAWFACLSIVVSVPADVKRSLTPDDDDDTLGANKHLLGAYWLTVFWSTFVFYVLVMPFLQQYSDSGGFFVSDRCDYAFRRMGRLLITVLVVLLSGFLLLLLVENDLKFSKFIGWIMAVLNAYGMIGAMGLLGFGLVDIPRRLWQRADLTIRIQLLYQTAGRQLENAADAHLELSKQINTVHLFDGQFNRTDKMRPYMDVIVEMLNRISSFEPQQTEENTEDYKLDVDTRQGLGVLRQRLRKGIEGYQRERERYLSLIKQFFKLHDTVENLSRKGMPFVYVDGRQTGPVWGRLVWWWRCQTKPIFQRLLALVAGFLSIIIILAEVTIPDYLPNISAFSQLLHGLENKKVPLLVCTFLMLLYVLVCSYYTLFLMGRFKFYLLVPYHTAPSSLASNALLMCRFACPLCFNFLTAVALPIKDSGESVEETVFWERIGNRISDSPVLGKYFTTYLPVLMLPYCLLIAFNGINRVMALCDPKKRFSFNEDWRLKTDSNYASVGHAMLNLELEHFQKGWELGLTITEGLRQAEVESGAAHLKTTPFAQVTDEFKDGSKTVPWVGSTQTDQGPVRCVHIPSKSLPPPEQKDPPSTSDRARIFGGFHFSRSNSDKK